MEKEKNCSNCKYYRKHYMILKLSLLEVGGHCAHEKIVQHNRNKDFCPRKNCKYWEDSAPLKEERFEAALTEISKIKRTLSDIALILKNED